MLRYKDEFCDRYVRLYSKVPLENIPLKALDSPTPDINGVTVSLIKLKPARSEASDLI